MEGFNEKKWFIYVGDHHEGPFSMEELEPRFNEGILTPRSYAWCEGFDDWKTLSDIAAFQGLLSNRPQPFSEAQTIAIPVETAEESTRMVESHLGPELALGPAVLNEAVSVKKEHSFKAEPVVQVQAQVSSPNQESQIPKESPAPKVSPASTSSQGVTAAHQGKVQPLYRRGVFQIPVLVATLAGLVWSARMGHLNPVLEQPFVQAFQKTLADLVQPVSLKLVQKFPALGGYISPIPHFEDVSQEDFEDLRSAAVGDPQQTGAKVSIALSLDRSETPRFYVSSNLPDGVVYDVYIEGISSTLLNHLQFQSRVATAIEKNWGLTREVRGPNGGTVPQGEYVVYVMEAESQSPQVAELMATLPATTAKLPEELPQGRKLVAKKIYFLGGQKDDTYQARLQEFHQRLKDKAASELKEVQEFSTTLETQFTQTRTLFTSLSAPKPAAAQIQKWDQFHKGWVQLDSQLAGTFEAWTPERIQNDFFYGPLYSELMDLSRAVRAVHEFQNRYFVDKNADRKALRIQMGEASSQADTLLGQLKLRIQQLNEAVVDTSGLPRRL